MKMHGDNEHPGNGVIECLACGKPVKDHSLLSMCTDADDGYPERFKEKHNQLDESGKRRTGPRWPRP